MLKRLFVTLAILSLGAVSFCSLPLKADVPSVFASGTIAGASQAVSVDLSGQSTCYVAFSGGSVTGTINAQVLPVGGITWRNIPLYSNAGQGADGIEYASVTSTVISAFTVYPSSSGQLQIIATAYTSGSTNVSINCTPAGQPPAPRDTTYGAQYVIFPTAQSVAVASLPPVTVNTAPPVTSVTAVPSCPPTSYPCGQPTPVPIASPVSASGSSVGVIVTTLLLGQSMCRFNLSGTWSATVKAKAESAGASTFTQLPIFDDNNLPYPSGVTSNGDYIVYPDSAGTLELSATSYTSGTIAANLNCSPAGWQHPNVDALGNQYVAFASPQPVTPATTFPISGAPTPIPWSAASPEPVSGAFPTPIPYQSYSGNILKAILTDTGGTAYTPASPQPVTTAPPPSPIPTAASPAPPGVVAQGYNEGGPAAPVICTKSKYVPSITTTATVILTGTSGTHIYVCGVEMTATASAASIVELTQGSSASSCASGTILTGYDVAGTGAPTVLSYGVGFGQVVGFLNVNTALCVVAPGSTLTAAHMTVMYAQF